MTELKPCPFCGGEAVAVFRKGRAPFVECRQCCIEQSGVTEAEAIAAWNTRPAPTDADVQRVAKVIMYPERIIAECKDEWTVAEWQARAALAAMGGSDGTD